MISYDKKVINGLLDTYENSLLSIGENRKNIQIAFRFTKSTMPAYFDESSNEYETIHIMMKELERKQLIQIIWKDNKKDFLIQKVQLQLQHITDAYRYVKRNPKRNLEEETIQLLQKYCEVDAPITRSFITFLINRLINHQSVKEYILLENLGETEKFLNACVKVEQNKEPCYVREFSILHFQDSKYFEQIIPKIGKVFRKATSHLMDCATYQYEDMDNYEILAEYSIYHTPNYVYFKGCTTLFVGDEKLDLRHFHQGIGISGEDLEKIQFSDVSGVKKVITIENLTSFFRYTEEDSLQIYLGGYHNGSRRKLLQMIYQIFPTAKYYHFGDIDAGGFSILLDLRKKTSIPFSSYRMDLDTLKQYMHFGKSLTESDRKRLKKIGDEEEFREVIRFMLEHNIKLEQECIFLTNGDA